MNVHQRKKRTTRSSSRRIGAGSILRPSPLAWTTGTPSSWRTVRGLACALILGAGWWASLVAFSSYSPLSYTADTLEAPKASTKRDEQSKRRRGTERKVYYTPPPFPFPSNKTFVSAERRPMIMAFLGKGFQQVKYGRRGGGAGGWHDMAIFAWFQTDRDYTRRGVTLKPWQRPNWTPGTKWVDHQDKLVEVLEMRAVVDASADEDSECCDDFSVYFPESYRLCDEASRRKFLDRLAQEDDHGNKNDVSIASSSAWVMKTSTGIRGNGITFLGPKSEELGALRNALTTEGAKRTVEKDSLSMTELCKANNVVQRYTRNVLTYRNHKFSVRAYFFVASFEPLAVYFAPGHLQVSPFEYDADDFSLNNTDQHFSQVMRLLDTGKVTSEKKEEWEISFEDYFTYLQDEGMHQIAPSALGDTISADRLLSLVTSQMKKSGVALVNTFRRTAFSLEPYKKEFAPENAYALLGVDFFLLRDLSVLMYDINRFPMVDAGRGKEDSHPFRPFLPEMVDVITEVYEKQLKGESVLPIQSADLFELIYTDKYQYMGDID